MWTHHHRAARLWLNRWDIMNVSSPGIEGMGDAFESLRAVKPARDTYATCWLPQVIWLVS
jgi:hypothetical protein